MDKNNKSVCWDCRKAIRIQTEYGECFVPCKPYMLDIPCQFVQLDSTEKEYEHQIIKCPMIDSSIYLLNERIRLCAFEDASCPDCPVDWSALRIKKRV